MKVKIHRIPEEGIHLEGEEPSSILDLHDPLFRFEEPIRYRLDITWVGSRSLLFRGHLSTVAQARCVRTLEWFELPLEIEDFQAHQEDVRGDEVDLTPQIREDMLLLLPANPVSPKAKPLKTKRVAQPKGGNGAWEALNQLKLK